MSRGGRLGIIAAVVATALGCSVAASLPPPDSTMPTPSASDISSSRSPSPSSSSGSPFASASALAEADAPIASAAWLLEQSSARFELDYKRYRPDETLRVAVAEGIVDPAGDRGSMRYDLFPDDAPDTPFRIGADLVWSATDWWARFEKPEWAHSARDQAPDLANLIGRVQEEPLALVRFAATAEPEAIESLPQAGLDGKAAERWLIRVPAVDAKAAYVPPDTYLGFTQVFDRDDLPLEVWLVDGRIVRLGYVLEREKSPAGVPDRHETWYDWSEIGDPIELTIPPDGPIREMGD